MLSKKTTTVATFLFSVLASTVCSAQEAPGWRLIREVRIGSLDDEATALSRITTVAVAPDLSVYVPQPQENLIRVFDAQGRATRTIGRAGEGPGEFRGLGGVVLRGDTLIATDVRQRRVSRFLTTGRHLSTERLPTPGSSDDFVLSSVMGFLAGGGTVLMPEVSMERASAEPNLQVPVALVDARGAVIGRFPPVAMRGDIRRLRRSNGVGFVVTPVQQSDIVRVAPDGSGVVHVRRPVPAREEEAFFWVLKMRTHRDTVFHRSYRFQPQAVSPAVRDSLVAATVESLERAVGRAEAVRFAREPGFVPRLQPGVSDAVVGDGGTVWLGQAALGVRSIPWVRLGVDGAVLGRVFVPGNVRVVAARGDRLWGVETGEWGEEYIVRYRVAP